MLRPVLFFALLAFALASPLKKKAPSVTNLRVIRNVRGQSGHFHHSQQNEFLLGMGIHVGNAPENPSLQVDLTSSDLEIDVCYNSADESNICFDPTSSTTFRKVSANLGTDTISSIDMAYDNYTLPNMTFLTKNVTVDDTMVTNALSGRVGFGWPALQKYPVDFFPAKYLQHHEHQMFSIVVGLSGCTARHYWGQDCREGEQGLTPNYVNVTGKSYWQFGLNGIKFGNINLPMKANAVVSSTSGYIGMPKAVLTKLVSAYNMTWDGLHTVYLVDCYASLPTLELIVDGENVKIYPNFYTTHTQTINDRCIVNFEDSKAFGFGPDWYFGMPLLQSQCVTFDYEKARIGFTHNSINDSPCDYN
uniref:Peptidase A1 domain-containing protein n=1 Tax=Steinernema glaseri TaxID=37863 RepID=A0A1I8AD54_9BILA